MDREIPPNVSQPRHFSVEEKKVKPEDLKLFDNVAHIDASVNSLSLGSFSSFVSLRELNLSLNGLCNMTFDAADFPHLEEHFEEYCKGSSLPLPELQFLNLADNKVEKRIQKVSKKPLLMNTQVEECEVTLKTTPASEGKNNEDKTLRENAEHFFVTQATDIPDHEFDLQLDEKETAENEKRNKDDAIFEKSTCYEMLMDAKPDPDVVEPVGGAIHGARVNKQEHKEALLLLRDMKTKYKMVHKKTMEQAASIESDRNTEQSRAEPRPVQNSNESVDDGVQLV
eukprot:superscaffoldBa00001530_g10975